MAKAIARAPDGAITLLVNGREHHVVVDPFDRLLDVLRERLDLTGTKEGCGEGECGACTVLLDGAPVLSCLLLAWQADGRELTTIEGLAGPEHDAMQRAFVDAGAVQCGFCTPGLILAAKALLDRDPAPSDDAIREGLAGNLCRCTGYQRVIAAVRNAAVARTKRSAAEPGRSQR